MFVVERYLGEDTQSQKEKDHLGRLIAQVKLREEYKNSLDKKNNSVSKHKNDNNEYNAEETTSTKNKKRKISYSNDESILNSNFDIDLSTDNVSKEKELKPKKRKKKKLLESSEKYYHNSEDSKYQEPEENVKGEENCSSNELRSFDSKNVSSNFFQIRDESNDPKMVKSSKKHKHKKLSSITDNDQNLVDDGPAEENGRQFEIIGNHSFNKKNEVKCVLSQWLAKPSVISVDLKNLEYDIYSIPDLNKQLVTKLQENKITHFFPVQSQLIPFLLKSEKKRSHRMWPVDICVSAPTGSGKTLAFVLPIIQSLMSRKITELQAIVILPVQDLATQVAAVFRKYVKGTGVSTYLTVGGTSLQQEQKHLVRQRIDGKFERLIDILITTPGRLVDHIYSTPGFTLKHLKYIVIDEADRLIDSFQNDWLYHLNNQLKVPGCPPLTVANLYSMPQRTQKLLFSATLTSNPEKLSELNLFKPHLFTSVVNSNKDKVESNKFIGKYTTPAELKEYFVRCERPLKPLVLFRLISKENWKQVLVFASSTKNVHNLATLLNILGKSTNHKIRVGEINSTMTRLLRQKLIERFTAGNIDVLVSTDSLARGIDIPGAAYVINYDVPKFIKSYIHRVGRTGRAGQDGTAVSLVAEEQMEQFTRLLKKGNKEKEVMEITIAEDELEVFEENYKAALQSLKEISEQQQKEIQEEKIMHRKLCSWKIKKSNLRTKKNNRIQEKKKKTRIKS
uniref:RNA helicase n=1 Tax=Clastoptera arizonana TaxID=38151 RepID=A0A1B6C6W5_9HEMI